MTISHARTDIESFTYLISNPNEESIDTEQRNQDFIDGLTEAGNLASANVEGAEKACELMRSPSKIESNSCWNPCIPPMYSPSL